MLREQEGGDEKPGQDEEQVDAEVAARERAVGMKKEHAEERRSAQTIERRDVTDAGTACRG
jgi:hypothetical protein